MRLLAFPRNVGGTENSKEFSTTQYPKPSKPDRTDTKIRLLSLKTVNIIIQEIAGWIHQVSKISENKNNETGR